MLPTRILILDMLLRPHSGLWMSAYSGVQSELVPEWFSNIVTLENSLNGKDTLIVVFASTRDQVVVWGEAMKGLPAYCKIVFFCWDNDRSLVQGSLPANATLRTLPISSMDLSLLLIELLSGSR
jgi:hypothetical protein